MSSLSSTWTRLFSVPQPRKIVCGGLNYVDHAAETKLAVPDEPLLFGKFASSFVGQGEPIVLPPEAGHVNAEAELAVVIGAPGSRIRHEQALDHIHGYTIANDVSARDLQFRDGQWFRGKAFDTFCPVLQDLVPAADFDPTDVRVTQRVNGQVLQDARTADMIFDVPTLVAYVSAVVTLEAGDLILTGTPPGVGYARQPPVRLAPGDVVEVEIDGLGVLRNPVIAAGP